MPCQGMPAIAPPDTMAGQDTETTAMAATGLPLLSITNLRVLYGGAIEAVRDLSLTVGQGRVVALLGANGAGKSTVLKAMTGILGTEDGAVEAGSIVFDAVDVLAEHAHDTVRRGLVLVPEGRRLFVGLSVDENLDVGGFTTARAELRRRREHVFELFPRLAERRSAIAGYLSGGEQQMVAIGRALMASPRLLVLDEPSLGLAPMVVDTIYQVIARLRAESGLTVLLVEQNAQRALAIADDGYIMERGRIVLDGPAQRLAANADVREFYLGMAAEGARSLREVKHYKRRKRWLS